MSDRVLLLVLIAMLFCDMVLNTYSVIKMMKGKNNGKTDI